MKLDDLKWIEYAPRLFGADFMAGEKKGCIYRYDWDGPFDIYEGVYIGGGAGTRIWRHLDALTAQCILIDLTAGGNDEVR